MNRVKLDSFSVTIQTFGETYDTEINLSNFFIMFGIRVWPRSLVACKKTRDMYHYVEKETFDFRMISHLWNKYNRWDIIR